VVDTPTLTPVVISVCSRCILPQGQTRSLDETVTSIQLLMAGDSEFPERNVQLSGDRDGNSTEGCFSTWFFSFFLISRLFPGSSCRSVFADFPPGGKFLCYPTGSEKRFSIDTSYRSS